jgi:predicted Zn-dependent peptidase
VPYADPDFYASQIFSTLLGGGMSSRLFQEAREKRGLCYSIFSFASSFVDGGLFGVYAGTGEDEIAELAEVVVAELLRAGEDAAEDEVARARAQLKAGTLMSLESSSSRIEQLGRQMLIYGRPLATDEIVARIEAVDAAAVRRVARRIAGAGKPTVAALGPLERLAPYEAVAARFG